MSPPEVWGPHVWRLLHTLVEKINEDAYANIYQQLVNFIQQICKNLPCPDCSSHATKYLTKVNLKNNKTKLELKNALYLFHNFVNAKKRKPLYNYANIDVYKNYKFIPIINNFLIHFNTKGNMKLLTESFQRQFVVKEFKKWINANIGAFAHKLEIHKPIKNDDNNDNNDNK
jgi:hypothetical protein